jgi:hypothetical protein
LLFDILVQQRVRDKRIEPLRVLLARYAAHCALDSDAARSQARELVRILNEANVPHVLLKSAAALYAGDTRVERLHVSDLDVLIPRSHAGPAVAALEASGYVCQYPDKAEAYARHHHHLSPMVHESYKRPVELHVQLSEPGTFSTANDWPALERHFEPVEGPEDRTMQLSAFGRCLHLGMHGASLHRLRDAVHIARELQSIPALTHALREHTQGESIQRVPLQSVICAAAQISGLRATFDNDVRRFVQWAVEREDLPPGLRARTQLMDAWYANGRRLLGPATGFAISCAPKTAAARIIAGAIVVMRLPALVR